MLITTRFVTNRAKARRAKRSGRSFLVASASLIVEGVLNGSGGPLFYPLDELKSSLEMWDGIPLTNGHPVADGSPVSVRWPGVWDHFVIGHVADSRIGRRRNLVADAWLDVALAEAVAPDVLIAVRNGEAVEVSTGLSVGEYEAAPPDAVDGKGRPYKLVARSYLPDHLAVLVHETGACSLDDGCGLLVGNARGVRWEPIDSPPLPPANTFGGPTMSGIPSLADLQCLANMLAAEEAARRDLLPLPEVPAITGDVIAAYQRRKDAEQLARQRRDAGRARAASTDESGGRLGLPRIVW